MIEKLKRAARLSICAALIFSMTACGTIMHPERKGQREGYVDGGVVVLDALGLLLFIIPGVIAFAVDFSNGTIYLPGGRHKSLRFDPRHGDLASIERTIKEETGHTVRLDQKGVKISRLKSVDELAARFSKDQ